MNKLINRISPETSENRILHAGFSIILMSEEITQTLSGLSSDMIIFILSGSITIYSTKEEKKTIGEQYMIFLRSIKYLQPIITQYFIGNKSEIWSLSLIVHSKG